MLFSEPKIPQLISSTIAVLLIFCFSALQRAENSSIIYHGCTACMFTSFSALQRAENSSIGGGRCMSDLIACFSALQRAENSSIAVVHHYRESRNIVSVLFSEPKIPQSDSVRGSGAISTLFQCSSASRKFLNPASPPVSNRAGDVSVLFSEPKIPQLSSCLLSRCG